MMIIINRTDLPVYIFLISLSIIQEIKHRPKSKIRNFFYFIKRLVIRLTLISSLYIFIKYSFIHTQILKKNIIILKNGEALDVIQFYQNLNILIEILNDRANFIDAMCDRGIIRDFLYRLRNYGIPVPDNLRRKYMKFFSS